MRVIRTALARQVSWEELRRGLAEAEKAAEGAVVEGVQDIKALKFESNQITMLLRCLLLLLLHFSVVAEVPVVVVIAEVPVVVVVKCCC